MRNFVSIELFHPYFNESYLTVVTQGWLLVIADLRNLEVAHTKKVLAGHRHPVATPDPDVEKNTLFLRDINCWICE